MTRATLGEISASTSHGEEAGRFWAQWEVLIEAAHPQSEPQWDRIERIASLAAPIVRTARRAPRSALPRMDAALRTAVRSDGVETHEADTVLATWERLLDRTPPLPAHLSDSDDWARGWIDERAALDPREQASS